MMMIMLTDFMLLHVMRRRLILIIMVTSHLPIDALEVDIHIGDEVEVVVVVEDGDGESKDIIN